MPQWADSFPPLPAAAAFSTPLPNLRIRNSITSDYFNKIPDLDARNHHLNRHVSYLARIIVDSRCRLRGLATRLLELSFPHIKKPLIETLFPPDYRIPLFQSLGFRLIANPPPRKHHMITAQLRLCRIPPEIWPFPDILHDCINRLPDSTRKTLLWKISEFLAAYRPSRKLSHSLTRTRHLSERLAYPTVYAYLLRPDAPTPLKKSIQNRGDPHHTVQSSPTKPKLTTLSKQKNTTPAAHT